MTRSRRFIIKVVIFFAVEIHNVSLLKCEISHCENLKSLTVLT